MKTLTAFTETAIDKPHVDVVRLLELTIGSTTLYFCDRVFGTDNLCVFNGQLYEPMILSWMNIKTGRIDPISYETEPGEAGFTVDNSKGVGGAASFTALFASDDPQYCAITISEIHAGATAAGDELTLFAGQIEDITEMTADRATVVCSGFELSIINKFLHTIVDTTNYPGADPDDLGKMIPQIYGEALRVPCIAADAGGKTTIAQDMTESTPASGGTLEVSDATALPSAGAFIFQVDSEQISIASRSGNTLTLAAANARGYADTTAVAHDKGAPGAEIQTSYVYIVADHPVNSIDTVYVDDIRQTSGFTAYTGQTGDEYTGYAGKAVVVFSALPNYLRQVNIEVDSTLDVDSAGRAVNDSGHSHAAVQQTIEWYFDDAVVLDPTVTNEDNICDGNLSSYATLEYVSQIRLDKITLESYSGPPQQYRIAMRVGTIDAGLTITGSFYGLTGPLVVSANSTHNNTTRYSPWFTVDGNVDTWDELRTQTLVPMLVTSSGVNSGTIAEVWLEVRYTPAASVSGYAAVALSGSNVLTGTVTLSGNSTAETVIGERIAVDAKGFQDDLSGTYTGTPSALIQRPNHIRKHILLDRCGQAASIIDSTSDSIINDFYISNGYVVGFPILQRPNVRNLLNRIARQSKAIEYWDAGTHHMVPVRVTESLSRVVEDMRIDLGQLWLKYTDRINIKNTLTATYKRQWSGHVDETESEREIVTASDSTSITNFGILQGDPLSYPYIADETQAQAVLDLQLERSKGPLLIVEFVGGYYLKDIERGDVVGFDVGESTLLAQATLGLIPSKLSGFRVLEKLYRSDGAIQLTAIYIGISAETVTPDNLAFAFTIDNITTITTDMLFDFTLDNLVLTQQHTIAIQNLDFAFLLEQIRFTGIEYFVLKEDNDFLLQENNDKIIQEEVVTILQEMGDALLKEDNDKLLTEI